MTRAKKLAGGMLMAILALAGCQPDGTFDSASVDENGRVHVEGTANEHDDTSRGLPMLFVVDKRLQIVVQPEYLDGCHFMCRALGNIIRDEWALAPGTHDICATALHQNKEIPADLAATPIEIDKHDRWVGCRDVVVPGPMATPTTSTTTTTTTVPETTTTTSTTTTTTSTTTTTIFDPGPPPPDEPPPFEP